MAGAKDVCLRWFVVIIVVVVDFGVRGVGVDDVPSVFPDGLETTLEPSELAVEAICPEFAEEATDIRGLCDCMAVCIVDEDARARMPGGESAAGTGGGQHGTELLEGEQGALEQGGGNTEGDGVGDAGRSVGSMGTNVDDEGGVVCEPGIEVGGCYGGKRGRGCRRGLAEGRGGAVGEAGGENAGRMDESVGNGLGKVRDIGLVFGLGQGDGVGGGVSSSAEKVHRAGNKAQVRDNIYIMTSLV